MSRTRRRSLVLAVSALVTAGVTASVPSTSAQAATYNFTVSAPVPGGIGVDAIYQNGGGGGAYDIDPCTAGTNPTLGWDTNGNLTGLKTVADNIGLGALTTVRFELYPGVCGTYSPWNDVGGVAVEVPAGTTNLGNITLPVPGQNGAFRIDGDVLSSGPIFDGRVKVDIFQAPTFFPDPSKPLQNNGIVEYGAFASGSNIGARWTGGVGWDGLYIIFVTDNLTKRQITTLTFIGPGSIPTIDLDAICFGFDTCTQSAGDPPPTEGTFHPTTPTRVLDTRFGVGIANGAVRTGDGRNTSPNPITRREEKENHELKVTGVGGIPESGVSAVLLNVTAVGAPGPGFISVVPKPARVGNIYDDQASYGAIPNTSNLNLSDGSPTPNLVLARVGAGGKIRIYNSFGPTGLIADVAGWFGTGGAHLDGAGFEGVTPVRLMDSRGDPRGRFAAGEVRDLTVAGVAGIPADAESVVVNITSVLPSSSGYVTAFPKGDAPPNASNVNNTPMGVRANQAVVKVGAGGQISLLAAESDMHMIVDVMGSFGPYGGKVTAIVPERFADSRIGFGTATGPLGPGESRSISIRGVQSVPADATGVIVNLTAVNPSGGGYITMWPTGGERPVVSNVNFGPGQTVPNLGILKIGGDGTISVFSEVGTVDFLIDVMAYVS